MNSVQDVIPFKIIAFNGRYVMATVNYDWDELEDIVDEEFDQNSNPIAEYTTEPYFHAPIVSQSRSSLSTFFHFDALGNTVELTVESGIITDMRRWTAYGDIAETSGTTVALHLFKGMRGYISDQELLLLLGHGGYYAPRIGRWIGSWSNCQALSPAITSRHQLHNDVAECSPPNPYLFPTRLALGNVAGQLTKLAGFGTNRYVPPVEARTELPCHRDCCDPTTKCTFAFSLLGEIRPDGLVEIGARVVLEMYPGFVPLDPLDPNNLANLRRCISDINRAGRPNSRIIVTIPPNLVCNFDSSVFKGGSFNPDEIDWPRVGPPECKDIIDAEVLPGGGFGSGGVVFVLNQPVISIDVDFTLVVVCGCHIGGLTGGDEPTIHTGNSGSLTLRGRIP